MNAPFNPQELKQFIVEAIEELVTPNPVPISSRFAGGTLILKPNNDTQPKEIPLEAFFRKIVSVRDGLRVLEQKINAHEQLTTEEKATFQHYITKSYGTLTTFNILFKEEKDKFVGSGAGGKSEDGPSSDGKLSIEEARRKIGLNEYGRR